MIASRLFALIVFSRCAAMTVTGPFFTQLTAVFSQVMMRVVLEGMRKVLQETLGTNLEIGDLHPDHEKLQSSFFIAFQMSVLNFCHFVSCRLKAVPIMLQ